jgi:hypothetical protein
MSTVPAALYAKHVPLWSKEEKRAHLDEYIRQLVEARDTIKQLLGSPEFHTPEVQAQINALADKFHMTEEAQPAVPQSQPAASAAASQPEGEGEGGFLRWLSGLWRGWTGDDPAAAAKQQDEPQRAVGQWTHIGQANYAAPSTLSLVSHCLLIALCAFPFSVALFFFSVFFSVQSVPPCCPLRLPFSLLLRRPLPLSPRLSVRRWTPTAATGKARAAVSAHWRRRQKGCAAVMRTPISRRGGAAEGGVDSCIQSPLWRPPLRRV